MDIDPRTHDLTGPRPPVEIQITIPLPHRSFTLEEDALADMLGGHVTVKHQDTGHTVDAVCQAVTYHKANHTITLRLQLPAHDLPRQGWTLAAPPTISYEPAIPPIPLPLPGRVTIKDTDITPYVRGPIDPKQYRIRPEL